VGNVQRAKRSRLPSIEQLQAKGNQHLQLENYKHASHCYSAVLQLAEGALDEEQMQTRRLCGLQLGKCEMKLGNLPSAIARFCEVISEAPDNAQNENTPRKPDLSRVSSLHLSRDLQRAHFLRALCLQCLHRPQLSALDIAASASYQINSEDDDATMLEEQTPLDAELNAFAERLKTTRCSDLFADPPLPNDVDDCTSQWSVG
jgi:tetratricopeptide (TPR) repeat protein